MYNTHICIHRCVDAQAPAARDPEDLHQRPDFDSWPLLFPVMHAASCPAAFLKSCTLNALPSRIVPDAGNNTPQYIVRTLP